MEIASKYSRFFSWLVTNIFVVLISLSIVFLIFTGFKVNINLEYKILTFYLILNALLWINFMIIPLLTKGFTIGHYLLKIRISGSKICFWNLFILSWNNSLFLLNFNSLIILVNNFPNAWVGFSYIAYFCSIIIMTSALLNAVSFILDKISHLTVNEIQSNLTIISISKKIKIQVKEKPVEVFPDKNLLNKNFNNEVDKILNNDSKKKLNSEQLEAVTNLNDSIRVVAGAGTGKTTVLTERFKYLVNDLNIPYNKILVVVFNVNAKLEIINRLSDIIVDPRLSWIHTYHSFCFNVLKREYENLNISRYFETLSGDDKKNLARKIWKEIKNDNYDQDTEEVLSANLEKHISFMKLTICEPAEFLLKKLEKTPNLNFNLIKTTSISEQTYLLLNKGLKKYLQYQIEKECLDFDDYIIYTHYLFKNFSNIKEKYEDKFEYILMDEFQDIDMHQYEIFKMLRNKNLKIFCVGDPDQCIYEWRNANPNIFLKQLEIDFPNLVTVSLNENYRSYQFILNAANKVIENNKFRIKDINKNLYTSKKDQGKIIYLKYNYANDETNDIARSVNKLISNGISPSEIAILYRNNFLAGNVEKSLKSSKINYKILNNISFFDRLEIKAALAYLKLLFVDSNIQLEYIINKPSRSIGEVSLFKLKEISKKEEISLFELLFNNEFLDKYKNEKCINFKLINLINTIKKYRLQYKNLTLNKKSLSDFLKEYLNEAGLLIYLEKISSDINEENRIENINSFLDIIINDLLNDNMNILVENNIIDYQDNHHNKNNSELIIISTIHGVKGLEFEHVFIISLAEEILLHSNSIKEIEQERRLIYVAFTRAKKQLYLSYHIQAPISLLWKLQGSLKPSRFIKEAGIK